MDQKTKNKFSYKSFKIVGKEEPAPETVLFTLKGNIKHQPGQFFQVALPHLGEATFAPCSDTEDIKNFELCIRAAGSTTNQMVKMLPGDELLVRGPYGNHWPITKLIGKNVIIAAGGMGIVPLRPVIYELLRYRKEFKKIALFAGFRTPHHVLFSQDLKAWHKKLDYCKIVVEKSESGWWGETGMITDAIDKMSIDSKNTVVLMCGPDIMFKFCNQVFYSKGLNDDQIYVSMERRMECGVGLCQHCNIGKYLVCKDGPVFRYDQIKDEIGK